MKKIAIVATGGTIAGVGKGGKTVTYTAGKINVDDILYTIPDLKDLCEIETYQLLNLDSNEMNEDHWLTLASEINQIVRKEDIDGVVITHGTDTLDETAYFLNLTLYTHKPIVITGAMRPASATSADGPFNLYQAICLALDEGAKGQGVLCLFSSTIYSARDIQKVNNFKIDAFDQKSLGCLGFMQDEKVYFYSKTFKSHTLNSAFSLGYIASLPKVAIAYYYAGADVAILDYLSSNHQGIVIIGSGSGNYSQAWIEKIHELYLKGTVFVRASRVNSGIVFDNPIFDPYHCCISANTLSGQKARVLLMLALTKTKDLVQIKDIFERY